MLMQQRRSIQLASLWVLVFAGVCNRPQQGPVRGRLPLCFMKSRLTDANSSAYQAYSMFERFPYHSIRVCLGTEMADPARNGTIRSVLCHKFKSVQGGPRNLPGVKEEGKNL